MRHLTSRSRFVMSAVLIAVAGSAGLVRAADGTGYEGRREAGSLTAALADDLAQAGAAAAISAPSDPPSDILALRRRIQEIVARSGGGGAAVFVVGADGTRLLEGFGPAGAGASMDAGTLFRVGSVTKSFLALAVMRLVEQGKLRLEDRVLALAPEIAVSNPWERTHPLTVAHLLEHTSGFDEMRFNEILDDRRTEDRPLAEVLAVNPRSRVVRWPPGTRHAYAQPGYTLVAYLIEKASGMPYERYMEEQVWRPLGITSASLRLTAADRARLAPGYEQQRPQAYVRLLHRPALNLMISAADLSRMILMLLGRGTIDGQRFLTQASVERIERTGTLPYGPPEIRYGLGNWGDVGGPVPMRGHGGYMPGYLTLYRYSPARRFGFAVMLNDPSSRMGAINGAIVRYLFARSAPPPSPALPGPSRPLASYAGSYQMASPSVEFTRFHSDVYKGIQIVPRGDRLWLALPDRPALPLVPSGPDQFRHLHQSGSSIQFTRAATGQPAVIVGQAYYEKEAGWWAWARKGALELSLLLLMSTLCVPVLIALRGNPAETLLLIRPAVAGFCLLAMVLAFNHARGQGQLGQLTLNTVQVWGWSWLFALVSYSGLTAVARASRTEIAPGIRAYVWLASGAAVWVSLHLYRYGLIGLKTWRW